MIISDKFLKERGWHFECESPMEIRHEDGSFIAGRISIEKYFDALEKQNNPWMTTLKEIAEAAYQNACNKGFHHKGETVDQIIEKSCNNMHDEISELHEAWRNNTLDELCDKAEAMMDLGLDALTNIEEEFADIIIRALETARSLDIDIEKAVNVKHSYNVQRPFKHGGKRS